MEESEKSYLLYKYCLIVKNGDILKGINIGVNVSLLIIHWKPYATTCNNKQEKYLVITW